MKKLLSLLLVGVMSVMLLAGCGTTGGGQDNPDSGSDETEKSISIAQSANFSMGFAPGVQSYETTYYMNNFYESLVEYRDGEYQPCLATDWTVQRMASLILSIYEKMCSLMMELLLTPRLSSSTLTI